MGLLDKFSIQLYSVRLETEKDFKGTVRKIADIGYTGVEFAGYGGIPADEMKSLLDECGLKSIGSHVNFDMLSNNLDEVIAYNKAIGTEYIVCPYSDFKSREQIIDLAKKCNEIGESIINAGMKFGYHNHASEFQKFNGEYGLDIFLDNTNPQNVISELDLYWMAYAGVEIMPYLDKYKDRIHMLHLKQIESYEVKRCVNLNKGVIDYKPIIQKAKELGCKHFILEQEEFDGCPFDALKINFDYVMSM